MSDKDLEDRLRELDAEFDVDRIEENFQLMLGPQIENMKAMISGLEETTRKEVKRTGKIPQMSFFVLAVGTAYMGKYTDQEASIAAQATCLGWLIRDAIRRIEVAVENKSLFAEQNNTKERENGVDGEAKNE